MLCVEAAHEIAQAQVFAELSHVDRHAQMLAEPWPD
jgi:hypothetical protein